MGSPHPRLPAAGADAQRLASRRLGALRPCPTLDSAAWIVAALRPFDHTVGSIAPPVFDAYARVFHPASRLTDGKEETVSWTEVAQANRRTMHPAAEWGSITGSWQHQRQSGIWDRAPETGKLPHQIAQRLVAVLTAHTADPRHSCFGVWEGWGRAKVMLLYSSDTPQDARQHARDAFDAEATAWNGLIDSAPRFAVPDRRMHILCGPLAAIDDFYKRYGSPPSLCLRNPPSLWWPGDRAWCVSTDIDLMATYIGASATAIDDLIADDQIEALQVPDDQPVTWDADKINPLPTPP